MDLLTITTVFSTILGIACGFEHGVRYEFQYETTVMSKGEKPFGFQLTASAHLTNIWKSPDNARFEIIKIEIISPHLSVFKKSLESQKSNLDKQNKIVLYVYRINNQVTSLHGITDENGVLKNIAKGIAGFLEYHQITKTAQETGLAGVCNVSYTLIGNTLTKSIDKCKHMSVNDCLRCAKVLRTSTVVYELRDENMFTSVEATDDIDLLNNLMESARISISSTTTMKLKKEVPNQPTIYRNSFLNAMDSLKTKHNDKIVKEELTNLFSPRPDKIDLVKTVQKYIKHLKTKQLAKIPSASAFLRLLKPFTEASKTQIKEVLTHKDFKPIIPQLLDIFAATGTDTSLSVILNTLDLSKGNSDLIERYLLSLSLTQHVTSNAVNKLLKVIENPVVNENVRVSLILTLGALTKTYSNYNDELDEKLIQKVTELFEKKLLSCEEDSCKLTYLRAFRNAALPSTIPFLKNYVEKNPQHSLEALLALKNIGFHKLNSDCVTFSERIYYSVRRKYDASSRTVAAEMLLQCYSNLNVLSRFLSSLEDQSEKEVSTFITTKVMDKMNHDQKFRSDVQTVISNQDVKNYLAFAQIGTSTTFAKTLFSTSTLNGTYGIGMEMLPGGLLRRSSFDINLHKLKENLRILSVGIFANGMDSFTSGSSDNEEETVPPTAGMELTLLDVSLRPYVFFVGTSELMKHAFAGTASEPLPALQGNFLLTNSNDVITLQNGINVKYDLFTVLSINLEASIQISLWYRTSKSEVKNGIALYVHGTASIDTEFVLVEDGFSLKGQSNMDFISDLEFAEPPFRMCMQMTRPGFPLKLTKQKELSVPGTKFLSKRNIKTTFTVPPISYAFHPQNNKLCSIMLNSDY